MKKTLPCHPILNSIIKEIEQGRDVAHWFDQSAKETIDIDGFGLASKAEVLYYYRKYLMLKENGYFSEINPQKMLSEQLTPEDVRRSLANSPILTFETTSRCELSCKYCSYGKLYVNYGQRNNKNLATETAKQLLRYLQKLWNSPLNISHDRVIYIGFYGGEPLLNFPFIEEIIRFLKDLKMLHHRFSYSMTTNGLLLEKYMDFLEKHEFNLLISLDGNEKNNEYRTTKSGKSSFSTLMKNAHALQDKYPDYFTRKVNFNAVVHNKNTVTEIFHFFKEHFNKYPSISSLNTTGISEKHKEEFWKTYANVTDSLYNSEDYSYIEKDMFIKLPNIQALTTFLHHKTDLSFNNYIELLSSKDNTARFPTGTCIPFAKKIFVTVDGKILVCERIGQEHGVGYVTPQTVHIDYESIAKVYNHYYDRMRLQCSNCYNADSCIQCIFHLPLHEKHPTCKGFMSRETYSRYVSSFLNYIEENPNLYKKIFKEVWVS
jgi:uncharacterized protein